MSQLDRILIFSPHPDDVELFLGGALLRHIAEGAAVKVVMVTYGDKGSLLCMFSAARRDALKRARREEVRQRFEFIPTVELALLNLPDMGVCKNEATVLQSLSEFDRFRPTHVYLPESSVEASYYGHPDHHATGQMVEAAAARYASPVRLRYFHSKNPTLFIDISPFHQENLKALRCYKSQYSASTGVPFLLHLYEVERYFRTRRYGKKMGVAFAEGFRESGAP